MSIRACSVFVKLAVLSMFVAVAATGGCGGGSGGTTRTGGPTGTGGTTATTVPQGPFSPTGKMIVQRWGHTATLLGNGMVLIAGGLDGGGYALASAELYDPATGTFTATGSMTVKRYGHTATLLPNGMVLIAGGDSRDPGGYEVGWWGLASAELYDPATGTFTATGSMTRSIAGGHGATLLGNGTVLITGGSADPSLWASAILLQESSAETYDPATGKFADTGQMTKARISHTATLLPSGMVLIAGDFEDFGERAELYNPAARTFATTGSMTAARCSHTATLLPNGTVLIASGFNSGISGIAASAAASAELYDPAAGTFTPTGSMTGARSGHTATLLLNGTVLIAGGYIPVGDGIAASAELYDPAAGAFTPTGSMTEARSQHTATLLLNGKVLMAGGKRDLSWACAGAELYESP